MEFAILLTLSSEDLTNPTTNNKSLLANQLRADSSSKVDDDRVRNLLQYSTL
jgi:hypothetical protein